MHCIWLVWPRWSYNLILSSCTSFPAGENLILAFIWKNEDIRKCFFGYCYYLWILKFYGEKIIDEYIKLENSLNSKGKKMNIIISKLEKYYIQVKLLSLY